MKKIITSIMTISLVFTCFAGPAMAATVDTQTADYYAYMDIDSASAEMQEMILEARNEIIYSQSWVVDGEGVILDNKTGETKSVPKFADLFPGWDVPVDPTVAENKSSDVLENAMPIPLSGDYFNGFMMLNAPGNPTPTVFAQFIPANTELYTSVLVIPGSTWNCGYSDFTTGASLGYAINLTQSQTFGMSRSVDTTYGVRLSTYSTTGYCEFRVY